MSELTFLNNWRVIILRAPEQALSLMNAIKMAGGEPLTLATLEIKPLAIPESDLDIIEKVDVLFVSSQHAVHFAPHALWSKIAQQKKLKLLTMGKATSQALHEKGLSAFFTLPSGGTSEDLLGQPFLQEHAIKNKMVLLLAGVGGRTLVHDTLLARQAKVEWMKVYQQHNLKLELTALIQACKKIEKMAFIATSVNILNNFMSAITPEDRVWLYAKPLIVISHRIAQSAKEWGFKHIIISKGTDCEMLMLGLQNMQQICDTTQ